VLTRCRAKGVQVAPVDLAVGLGTFRPVTAARAEDHVMHRERYRVPAETLAACSDASRVVAVGTTTLRALESAAATGQLSGSTELYIFGDYEFRVTDLLLTNFHQPRSSLLLLLEAFCGPRWRDLYAVALAEGYRFLSFGDAMLVQRRTPALSA
jgi:S-adenosylmethionine:tRNA ribosyltransferase-isomerase